MSDFDRWLERTPEDDPERDERQSFLDALDDSEQADVEEAVLRAEATMLEARAAMTTHTCLAAEIVDRDGLESIHAQLSRESGGSYQSANNLHEFLKRHPIALEVA